jgi:serine/threonine protein kinase
MLGAGLLTHEMKGTQFPFGVLKIEEQDIRKAFVKKRYLFKDEEEYEQIKMKVDKLKNISHKNSINLRSAEETSNSITLVYQYVPFSLEDSFMECPNQTVKEMHRQFIELAIYFAKNCIVTTFNPQRCGVLINEGVSTLKYYLPLPDLTITNNRSML